MKAQCGQCEIFHNMRIDFPTEKEFRRIRSFLGEYLGEGLKKEDLSTMIVARLDYNGKIIGCLQTVSLTKPFIYLTRLKIAKPFRHQGIAEELMKRALLRAREKGFTKGYTVTLMSGPEKLVVKLGAKEINKSQMTKYVPKSLLVNYDSENKFKFWFLPNSRA